MTIQVSVTESSQVAEARRIAAGVAAAAGLPELARANLAIVVTELATNLIKHGGGGTILLDGLLGGGTDAGRVRVISADTGPGMGNVARSLSDGYSTAGTQGTGMGAVRRLSQAFDVWTGAGRGTVVMAVLGGAKERPGRALAPEPGFEAAGVSVAMKGESVCGDAWSCERLPGRMVVLVVDGLGHGPLAADASDAAVRTFRGDPSRPPQEHVDRIHGALRSTRGAAVAVADIDVQSGVVRYCGIGNIAGAVVSRAGVRRMVSHNGTAGQAASRIAEFSYPWEAGSLLVMHSDGLTGRWDVHDYPGLTERDPAVVAAVLLRDHTRGRDDATVAVVRGGAG